MRKVILKDHGQPNIKTIISWRPQFDTLVVLYHNFKMECNSEKIAFNLNSSSNEINSDFHLFSHVAAEWWLVRCFWWREYGGPRKTTPLPHLPMALATFSQAIPFIQFINLRSSSYNTILYAAKRINLRVCVMYTVAHYFSHASIRAPPMNTGVRHRASEWQRPRPVGYRGRPTRNTEITLLLITIELDISVTFLIVVSGYFTHFPKPVNYFFEVNVFNRTRSWQFNHA